WRRRNLREKLLTRTHPINRVVASLDQEGSNKFEGADHAKAYRHSRRGRALRTCRLRGSVSSRPDRRINPPPRAATTAVKARNTPRVRAFFFCATPTPRLDERAARGYEAVWTSPFSKCCFAASPSARWRRWGSASAAAAPIPPSASPAFSSAWAQ